MTTHPRTTRNRKLLVSVFNAQEAREAVLGGGRIIDSEDPKSALGNISPRHIMDVRDAVLDFQRDLDVQLSTNIGEDQLLFRRSQTGMAIEKSPYEIAGKAAQAGMGVALAMGSDVHPINFVKVGVDGMSATKVVEVIGEVVRTLRRTQSLTYSRVMSVLFAQDLVGWRERRQNDEVRRTLIGLREFNPASEGEPGAFDVTPFAVGTLRDHASGQVLYTDSSQVSLATLVRDGVLPEGANGSFIRINDLFEHQRHFPKAAGSAERTTRGVIKEMVDATAAAGADAIMIDTSILSKVSNLCLIDTRSDGMVDVNSLMTRNGLVEQGILTLDELRFFVDYCHFRGVSANLAGSIQSYQAQQLWMLIPELDQCSTRGAASAVTVDPSRPGNQGADTRQMRVIKRQLVRGLAPPEHGGVLNLPAALQRSAEGRDRARALVETLRDARDKAGDPDLDAFWIDSVGNPTPFAA
jgi:uncharacterized protein (UPF0264 family)